MLRGILTLLLLGASLRSIIAQELVVVVESPTFALDTRLSSGSNTAALVVTAISPAFTLDTRLATGTTPSALVVTVESPSFTLDARLATPLEELIVKAVSPAFEVNTMWVAIRQVARAAGSPVEVYWTTNAPGFHLQSGFPPLGPAAQWLDVPTPPTESGGLNRVQLNPSETNLYFRLKL